jgi:hypothetical protein
MSQFLLRRGSIYIPLWRVSWSGRRVSFGVNPARLITRIFGSVHVQDLASSHTTLANQETTEGRGELMALRRGPINGKYSDLAPAQQPQLARKLLHFR